MAIPSHLPLPDRHRKWQIGAADYRIADVSDGYPMVLDVSRRLIVIVGGGEVALRKVSGLMEAGATRLRAIAPTFHAGFPVGLERCCERYRAEHLTGASLVFAATDDPQVNEAVVQDARRIGALVCRADADEENAGDFATPAAWRNGAMMITVSTGGSPALSALVRDRIRERLDPRLAQMATAMQVLRPLIRASLPAPHRREVFRELCSESALEQLSGAGIDGLRRWLGQKYPMLNETTESP